MKSYINDIVRRVEILASIMNGEIRSKEDFTIFYKVSGITIDRDLKWLRTNGIQIFSKKKSLVLTIPPQTEVLNKILSEYLPLKLNSDIVLKQIHAFSKTKIKNSFQHLALIAKGVKEQLIIKIVYSIPKGNIQKEYELKPLGLFTNELNWLLHAAIPGEDIVKTFYVSRIIKLELTKRKFQPAIYPKNKNKKFEMVFKFEPRIADEIYDKIWFEDFEIVTDPTGFIILKTKQVITNKLSAWCISWWDQMEIIEPQELKDNILQMIEDFRKKNKL